MQKTTESESLYTDLESQKPIDILTWMNSEDKKVALVIETILPDIDKFVTETWGLKLEASILDEYNLERSIQAGKLYNMPIETSPPIEIGLTEGGEIKWGNSSLTILFTPGHSAGSLSFYSEEHKILISGDVLFKMSIGRTDLPGGDFDTLISTIKTKLFILPEETIVYSGHGDETTIGDEMKNNPFLV